MRLNCLSVNEVPFPYFILNQNLKVLKRSNPVSYVFQQMEFFGDLIDDKYHHEILHFFSEYSSVDFIEIPMNVIGNKKQFFQIYKAIDESAYIHVYCIPLKKELDDVNEILNTLEEKIVKFNQELLEKKGFLENAINEMKGAAKTIDDQNNVGKLAAGIAHEIRNPLTTVKGFLQLLKPYLKELGKVEYADVALEEINRANDIIYEFLNATKPQTKPSYGVSINKLVKDIALLYESEAILRDIQINTSFSSEDKIVTIDSNLLKQVLINLIKNAIEAIDESLAQERTINISTVIDSESINIHVADSGCGMTDETMKSLFTPFFSTKEKGTGIGLNLCKKVIEENGGTISLNSILDKGTTFSVCFPVKTVAYS